MLNQFLVISCTYIIQQVVYRILYHAKQSYNNIKQVQYYRFSLTSIVSNPRHLELLTKISVDHWLSTYWSYVDRFLLSHIMARILENYDRPYNIYIHTSRIVYYISRAWLILCDRDFRSVLKVTRLYYHLVKCYTHQINKKTCHTNRYIIQRI